MDVAEEVVRPIMPRQQVIDRAGLLLGYAGVYGSVGLVLGLAVLLASAALAVAGISRGGTGRSMRGLGAATGSGGSASVLTAPVAAAAAALAGRKRKAAFGMVSTPVLRLVMICAVAVMPGSSTWWFVCI